MLPFQQKGEKKVYPTQKLYLQSINAVRMMALVDFEIFLMSLEDALNKELRLQHSEGLVLALSIADSQGYFRTKKEIINGNLLWFALFSVGGNLKVSDTKILI